MKFIKQLDENHFIVEMGKEDTNGIPSVDVAHDYIQFNGWDCHCEDFQTYGPYGHHNVVSNQASVQIPIRMAQDMLKTILKREYMQPDHLVFSDGTLRYLNTTNCVYSYSNDEGTEMVAVMDPKTGEFIHLPYRTYCVVKNETAKGK
jgi:hypothetical protein